MALTTQERDNIVKLAVGMFNAAPGSTYLQEFTAFFEANGRSLSSLANYFAGSSAYKGIYPNFQSAAEFASTFLTPLGLQANTVATDFVTSRFNKGQSTQSIMLDTLIALDATTDSAFTTAKAILNNKTSVATTYSLTNSALTLSALQAVVSSVDATAASVTAANAANSSASGNTFTLTTSAEVLSPTSATAANKTSAGNDTIYGLTLSSLTSGDVIDGGDGTDSIIADYDVGAASITVASVLTSVENVTIKGTATANNVASTFTLDTANSSGIKSVTFSDIAAGAAAQALVATGLASGTAVGIKNSVVAGADTYTFRFTNAALAGSADTVTLNINDATTATGAVTITNATTATGSNDGAETVLINVANTLSTATSTIASLTVGDGTNARMNTLKVAGAGKFTISGAVDFEGTANGAVDTTGATGTVTLTLTNGELITYTGGTAKDTITIGSTNDVINTGAGDDQITLAIANLTNGKTIDMGAGTRDAIIYNNVTTLDSTGVSAANLASLAAVAGVEIIGSSGAVTAINADYFTQTLYKLSGALTAAVTMSNVSSDTLIISSGINMAGAGDALTVSGLLPNQTFTLELSGSAGVTLAGADGTAGNTGLTIASGIQTVNIVSNTSATTSVTNTIANAAAVTATHAIDNVSADSFVLTGSTNLTITKGLTAGFTNAVDFNAANFTGVLNIDGSASADIIVGGSGADLIEGMGGNDRLTGNAGADQFQMLGVAISSGNDTITDFTMGTDLIDIGYVAIPAALTTATLTGAATIATGSIYVINYGAAIGTTDFSVAGATGFGLLFGATKALGTTVALTDDFMVIVQGTDKTVLIAFEDAAAVTLANTDIDAIVTLSGVTNATTLSTSMFM